MPALETPAEGWRLLLRAGCCWLLPVLLLLLLLFLLEATTRQLLLLLLVLLLLLCCCCCCWLLCLLLLQAACCLLPAAAAVPAEKPTYECGGASVHWRTCGTRSGCQYVKKADAESCGVEAWGCYAASDLTC
eukprot:s6034_g2.t1